jgi:predicted nucleic acid-binding protein
MRVVVDASVALKWLVEETGSDLAERVAAQHELIAPELIVAEVQNALWRVERAGRLIGGCDRSDGELPALFRSALCIDAARAVGGQDRARDRSPGL